MEKKINSTQYQEGIFDICDSLVTDLLKFLKDEGRYKYKMVGLMETVTNTLETAYDYQDDEEINIYGRVLYVLKKPIIKEYQKLRMKKLSPGDCVICIIRRLINISENLSGGNKYKDLQDKIKPIFEGFFGNIKNRGKNYGLPRLEHALLSAVEEEKYGVLSEEDLDLYSIEHPAERNQELVGEKNSWSTGNSEEISL